MEIRVNGTPTDLDAGTIAALVERLKYTPAQVAVEQNGLLVRRTEWADTALSAGDSIEVVTLVGGG